MTRQELVSRSFKPYMVIHYQTKNMDSPVDGLLCAIHFENETMDLQLLETEKYHVPNEIVTVSISVCSVPKLHRNRSKEIKELKQ